jgi:hypothetical protein
MPSRKVSFFSCFLSLDLVDTVRMMQSSLFQLKILFGEFPQGIGYGAGEPKHHGSIPDCIPPEAIPDRCVARARTAW